MCGRACMDISVYRAQGQPMVPKAAGWVDQPLRPFARNCLARVSPAVLCSRARPMDSQRPRLPPHPHRRHTPVARAMTDGRVSALGYSTSRAPVMERVGPATACVSATRVRAARPCAAIVCAIPIRSARANSAKRLQGVVAP